MIQREIRNYEISIWTLQDDFITVLKYSDIEHKGQVQEGELKLNVDGTQSLSFTIPMHLYKNNQLIENPIWYNYINGTIIANMRKIKVILNKLTPDEEIFEFIITKVTETHEKNETQCQVECEGLAFHELGKTGYKVSLKQEDFEYDSGCYYGLYPEEYDKGTWNNPIKDELDTTEPIANIEYWANKFLVPYPADGILNPRIWYYKVEMDWSSYTTWNDSGNRINRASNKIYEDEYVGSWKASGETIEDYNLQADHIIGYMEKARLMDAEESNKYNLSQDLAEKFGVYCKYVYLHDDTYHITGRYVVFYNSFIEEQKGAIDITYKYNAKKIEREMDGTDLVTKMYVKNVESDTTDSGLISIVDVEANKTREDYILNFEYMHNIGAISEESYQEIDKHEQRLRYYNDKLIPIAEQLTELQFKKPEVEANVTFYENAIKLDQEQIKAQDDWLMAVTNNDGIITKDPATAVAILDDTTQQAYINVSYKGIIVNTLKCYNSYNSLKAAGQQYEDEITKWEAVYDEFNDLKRINLNTTDTGVKYLKFDYCPADYHERVKQIWISRLHDDEKNKLDAKTEVDTITEAITNLQREYNELLKDKQKEIADFERMMGPALREGNWQSEDYKDYGDRHTIDIVINDNITNDSEDMVCFKWDEPKFDEELKTYFEIQANQSREYCLAIELTSTMLEKLKEHKEEIEKLSLLYYDYTAVEDIYPHKPQYRRALTLGSKMFFAFAKINSNSALKPILLVTGTNELSENQIDFLLQQNGKTTGEPVLGALSVSFKDDTYQVKEVDWIKNVSIIRLNENSKIYYPRIIINSLSLKTSSDELILSDENKVFNNFEDYSVLTYETDECYYLTIKPETLIENYYEEWNSVNLNLRYSISNASTAIYLDAIQVLKDSSIPQVSYSVDISLIQKERIKTTAKLLNRIVHINDNELHFENVQGYVSEVTLNLDQPWEDKIEIKNYKTKFEDLFEKIVASSEQMKKNEYISGIVSDAFDNTGLLSVDAAQDIADKIAAYSFDGGNLTITKEHGILAESKEGIVAMRGDGIFTATEKDDEGNWNWTSGITPSGINANLITAGQIDTNRLRIFAGDQLRFQMNADGLFAYKAKQETTDKDGNQIDIEIPDLKTYVVMNEDGLFLHRSPYGESDADQNEYDKVEVSWDGFKIRNAPDSEVFYADDQGNLTLSGEIIADSGKIGAWIISNVGEDVDSGALYYISDSRTVTNVWDESELYLGPQGLKMGDALQIKTKVEDNKKAFDNFIIYDPSSDSSEDYLFRIAANQDGEYSFDLQHVHFDEGFIKELMDSEYVGNYKTTQYKNNTSSDGPDFSEDSMNGSLGILYTEKTVEPATSEQQQAIKTIIAKNDTLDRFLARRYNDDEGTMVHSEVTYFGMRFKRWNVNTGSADGSYATTYKGKGRVGVAHSTSNTCASFSSFSFYEKITSGSTTDDNTKCDIAAGQTFTITFDYYTKLDNLTWDVMSANDTRASAITVEVYTLGADDDLASTATKIASGTYKVPSSVGFNTDLQTGSITLKATHAVTAGTKCYAVFYSKVKNSLIYLVQQSVKVGEAGTPVTPVQQIKGAYYKSYDEWYKLLDETDVGAGLKIEDGKITLDIDHITINNNQLIISS